MLIYSNNNIRVYQHPHLQIFHVKKWMEGDNPRSYGRTWDFFTVEECRSIDRVNELVKELLEKG